MTAGFILIAAGIATIVASELIARRLAPRYVLGRTLAGARDVSIEHARQLATAGAGRYVRVHGRISSAEEFPDQNDRPLVYRRKRIEARGADGRWRVGATETEGVPFGVESRSSFVAVDAAALGAGLVVVPRHSEGIAADLPADLAPETEPTAAARLVIEQVSAVEHAYVAGVPVARPDGEVVMSPGRRRPLILTTLDIEDAMRLLGAGQRLRSLALSGMMVAGIVLVVAGAAAVLISLV